jgi:hypothetical protein
MGQTFRSLQSGRALEAPALDEGVTVIRTLAIALDSGADEMTVISYRCLCIPCPTVGRSGSIDGKSDLTI